LLYPIKVEEDLPPISDGVKQQEKSHGLPRSVLSNSAERHGAQRDTELSAGTSNFYLVWSTLFSQHHIAYFSYTQFWGYSGLILSMQTLLTGL
jgi:hypothetical protein